jgi:two-component system cell cycle response regulator
MSKSILIIEDTLDTLELLQTIFEGEGYDVKTATTGEYALEILDKEQIHVVILDIMLPRIDGFEVLRRMKSNPKTRKIPIVALTAYNVPKIVQRCQDAGVDDTILKPFESTDLVARVNKILEK